MTTFSISGQRNGAAVTVTWTDGELSGDEATVSWIKQLALMLDGSTQGPIGGPYTMVNHLSSPYSARAVIQQVFPGKTTFSGKLPTIDLPDGAIM